MIKRTLCFSSPGRLRLHLRQLIWQGEGEGAREASIPVEDIGLIIIESPLISISAALLQSLAEALVAVVLCDRQYLPASVLLPQTAHTRVGKLLRFQLALTEAQKRKLWQLIITAKIRNQAHVLAPYAPEAAEHLQSLAKQVKRGDDQNREAQAARLYFAAFPSGPTFHRERFGDKLNAALNYGYALLRATVARALVASGLLPAIGLHHTNQYNHFPLADDLMEPYRPFVDQLVLAHLDAFTSPLDAPSLTPENKRLLLPFLTQDVCFGQAKRPLWNALLLTSASLARAMQGRTEELLFPTPTT